MMAPRPDKMSRRLADANIFAPLIDYCNFRALDRGLLNGKTMIDTRGVWRDIF